MIRDKIILKGEVFDRLTDEEFFHFCQENAKWRIERNYEGKISIMSPTGAKRGRDEIILSGELYVWNKLNGIGEVFSSSTGFLLPDHSVLSPDASFVRADRWNVLSEIQQKRFAPIAPDFVAEIKSPSDSLAELQQKMECWCLNGVQLAWLIDPAASTAWIYRPDHSPRLQSGSHQILKGEEVLPGFSFALELLT